LYLGEWKEIAWNGISFEVPGSWEIAEIGVRHLILEDDSGPAMEVKWGPLRGKFSHRAHLKRIGAFQTRQLKKTFKEWPLLPAWEEALSGFQTSGFTWHTDTKVGRGVILYCPVCRKAALIQFLQPKGFRSEKIPLKVLSTFQDHREDDQTIWSVFDIRASMPANFVLASHRFEPGNFELAFEHGSRKVFLYRWAPASVLLVGQDLAGGVAMSLHWAMALLIFVLYLVLNAATRGYYVWVLRVAAAILVAAGVAAVLFMA